MSPGCPIDKRLDPRFSRAGPWERIAPPVSSAYSHRESLRRCGYAEPHTASYRASAVCRLCSRCSGSSSLILGRGLWQPHRCLVQPRERALLTSQSCAHHVTGWEVSCLSTKWGRTRRQASRPQECAGSRSRVSPFTGAVGRCHLHHGHGAAQFQPIRSPRDRPLDRPFPRTP